jgi:hypothetical protein
VPNELPAPALSRRACLGGLLAAALVPRRAQASGPSGAPSGPGIDRAAHLALAAPGGWTVHAPADARGVRVSKKALPSLGAVAWMGEKALDLRVDPDHLMDLIGDVAAHARLSDELAASVVLSGSGPAAEYYQVLKVPPLLPVAPRYWISTATEARDLGGMPGHHRRAWSSMPPGARPAVEAQIRAQFPGAVPLGFTHGTWEVWPAEGALQVRYRTVSDPGGAVPDALAAALAGRALPATILRFERAALPGG